MLRIIKYLFGWIKSDSKKQKRNHPENLKPGEIFLIEWDRIDGGIGRVTCVNNDQHTKKIFLQVTWGNYKDVPGAKEKEMFIVDYNHKFFKNFNLLNPLKNKEQQADEIDDYDISKLQSDLNKALDNQEYEKAREIQNKIDKLINKK